jgi:hypothetical protein
MIIDDSDAVALPSPLHSLMVLDFLTWKQVDLLLNPVWL